MAGKMMAVISGNDQKRTRQQQRTSSKISSFGLRTSALARAMRCLWPPDSSLHWVHHVPGS